MTKTNRSHRNATLRVRASVAVLSGLLLAAIGSAAHAGPPAGSTPVHVVLFGTTSSESAVTDKLLTMFENVVVPAAVEQRARLVVALVSGDSAAGPTIAADVSFARVTDAAEGNPHYEHELITDATDKVVTRVRRVVTHREPAPASDWFGATVFASQIFKQFPSAAPKRLTLVGDLVNTAQGCNVSARDLSPANYDALFSSCTHGALPPLRRVHVVNAGIGLGAPASLGPALQAMWNAYFAATRATVDCQAATLVADCSKANQP